jgi:hypothetical protein
MRLPHLIAVACHFSLTVLFTEYRSHVGPSNGVRGDNNNVPSLLLGIVCPLSMKCLDVLLAAAVAREENVALHIRASTPFLGYT